MEELTEKLDSVIQKFQNHKTEIFNNSINTQTIKHYAILLKDLISKISENEGFNKMLKSEDVKTYYEEKYLNALQALEKLENERQSSHRPEKPNHMIFNENDRTPKQKSEKKWKVSSKARKMETALQEISHQKDLMDIEESHFVGENEYRSILTEIKSLEEELKKLDSEKIQKDEQIKEMEKRCLAVEAELKQFFEENAKLRKQLEDNHSQNSTFQIKNEEIENQLKKDTERLSFAQHKSLYLQKINKELIQNFNNIQEEIKKTKEENEAMEKLCQDKIKEMGEVSKDKQWSFLKRSNSFRASITPNKTNIIISDKADSFFFKAKIITPEDSAQIEKNSVEGSNEIEFKGKTPLKTFKKISCFEDEIENNNTIAEVLPSNEKTMQSDVVPQNEVIPKKDRSCGCLDFSFVLKIC